MPRPFARSAVRHPGWLNICCSLFSKIVSNEHDVYQLLFQKNTCKKKAFKYIGYYFFVFADSIHFVFGNSHKWLYGNSLKCPFNKNGLSMFFFLCLAIDFGCCLWCLVTVHEESSLQSAGGPTAVCREDT